MLIHRVNAVALILLITAITCADDKPISNSATPSFHSKIVFFESTRENNRLVETMSPDGTNLQTLLELKGLPNYRIQSGRISPDEKSVAFTVTDK
ncbi:MAG TPA: hypothetical protein VGI75_05270, partial [Pirellulales bacterium]